MDNCLRPKVSCCLIMTIIPQWRNIFEKSKKLKKIEKYSQVNVYVEICKTLCVCVCVWVKFLLEIVSECVCVCVCVYMMIDASRDIIEVVSL